MLGVCTRTICSNSSAHQRRATGLLDGDLILLVVLGEIAQRRTRIFHHLDLVGVRGERRQNLRDAALLGDEDTFVVVDSEIPHRPTRLLHHTGMFRMVVQRRQNLRNAA